MAYFGNGAIHANANANAPNMNINSEKKILSFVKLGVVSVAINAMPTNDKSAIPANAQRSSKCI